MTVQEWCLRWNVPAVAMLELDQVLDPQTHTGWSSPAAEQSTQSSVRLHAVEHGSLLLRNNSGVAKFPDRVVRYGLGNDSERVNKHVKSSDLIGITTVVVPPAWVGRILGVFTAVEMKHANWQYSESDKRARAQLRFIEIVRRRGGFAGFATGIEDFHSIIEGVGACQHPSRSRA